ncbi:MAG: SGNH/GDSL hydrolase family protein, partial [Ruminococcus sp.]|nr:SGNH/GDSL hydrolase family protein [Ruminococcus sp.]
QYCDQVPLPQIIGADRDVKYRITAIGDSITQGCQTEFMAYEFWAARIAQMLGKDYSFQNCGLGWSRTSDAAKCGDWLKRASASDIVVVAFGTNDIVSGEYGGDGANTASEIDEYLRTVLDKLKEKNCQIIVFNAPPEDYLDHLEAVRVEYNEKLKATCEEYGVFLFDFASLLSDKSEPKKALYGGHPNGEGGKIVADEFLKLYKDYLAL